MGAPERPISASHTALIRLVYQEGLDRESCPAIVCCGGRMDFHSGPVEPNLGRAGATAKKGDSAVL